MVAYVTDLAPNQADEVVEKRGPNVDRAYDADGQPTKAAQGFARGQGVEWAILEVRDEYIYAVKRVEGKATMDMLPELCGALMDGLRWRKTMRWNASNAGCPRPPALAPGPLWRVCCALHLGGNRQRQYQPCTAIYRRSHAAGARPVLDFRHRAQQ